MDSITDMIAAELERARMAGHLVEVEIKADLKPDPPADYLGKFLKQVEDSRKWAAWEDSGGRAIIIRIVPSKGV